MWYSAFRRRPTPTSLWFVSMYIGGSTDMARELHFRATVQPGGKIEIASPELTAGEDVDVTISPAKKPGESGKRSIVDILAAPPGQPHSAWDIISQAPGHLVFKSAEEVDEYIREERASWDR